MAWWCGGARMHGSFFGSDHAAWCTACVPSAAAAGADVSGAVRPQRIEFSSAPPPTDCPFLPALVPATSPCPCLQRRRRPTREGQEITKVRIMRWLPGQSSSELGSSVSPAMPETISPASARSQLSTPHFQRATYFFFSHFDANPLLSNLFSIRLRWKRLSTLPAPLSRVQRSKHDGPYAVRRQRHSAIAT